MKGLRTFYLSLYGLTGYIAIMLLSPQLDPFAVGLGIGMIIGAKAAKDAVEYYSGSRYGKKAK